MLYLAVCFLFSQYLIFTIEFSDSLSLSIQCSLECVCVFVCLFFSSSFSLAYEFVQIGIVKKTRLTEEKKRTYKHNNNDF